MRKVKKNVWGREFKLEVIFDAYAGEHILDVQRDALLKFLDSDNALDGTLEKVKKHCLEDENMMGCSAIDNVFKYVIPKSLFVERSNNTRKIVLICDYKWDLEHGLELTFENEKFKGIR